MKYKDFYKELLTEGRKEDVLNRLKKIGRESDLSTLMTLDKTPTKKHAVKLADYYVEVKDLGIVESYYNRFIENGNLNTKDINQWKTFKDFENIVDSSNVKVSKAFGEIEEKPIYEDDKIRVFHGDSKEKCIKLSNGYTFCIGRNDGGNLYNHYRYNAETTFYFIRFKDETDEQAVSDGKYLSDHHYIVIQSLTDGRYFLTVSNNVGDEPIEKEEIIKRYPETEVLFNKNIIKPLLYSDKDKHILSRIKDKPFDEMKTLDDQLLWAEFNPNNNVSDFEFSGSWVSDEFRKKYMETRFGDISTQQLSWLDVNRPALYKRYVDIKNNHLLIKTKSGNKCTPLELRLATNENFEFFIKNSNLVSGRPSFIDSIFKWRGQRGGITAKQLLENVTIVDERSIEMLIKTGLSEINLAVVDFLKKNNKTILPINKETILSRYFSAVSGGMIEKALDSLGFLLENIERDNEKVLYDLYLNHINYTQAPESVRKDALRKHLDSGLDNNQLGNTYLSVDQPIRNNLLKKMLEQASFISDDSLYSFLDYEKTRKFCIEYFIDRYKSELKTVAGGDLLYWILSYAELEGDKYYKNTRVAVSNYVSEEDIQKVEVDIKKENSREKLNENTSSHLESLRTSLLSKGVDNFLHEKNGTIYLSKIRISKPNRGKGLGSAAMEDITKYADSTNQIIVLSPDISLGATSVDRLRRFYKRFGFKDNSGSKKNYKYTETMIRYPNGSLNEQIEVKYLSDGQIEEDDEDRISDFHDQIYELEKSSGISILRGKELNAVLVEDNIVLGALYTELSNSSNGEEFSFDVIVKPEYRNKGLGDKLVKLGLDDYKSLKNSYSDKIKLKIDCVNPILISTFKKYGLKVVKTDGNHTIMSL